MIFIINDVFILDSTSGIRISPIFVIWGKFGSADWFDVGGIPEEFVEDVLKGFNLGFLWEKDSC